MSELKAKHVVDVYDEYSADPNNEAQVYLKSEADREIRKQKRKRCLTMADWCEVAAAEMKVKHDFDTVNECKAFYYHRELWWRKWKNRWLELADKFKEAK